LDEQEIPINQQHGAAPWFMTPNMATSSTPLPQWLENYASNHLDWHRAVSESTGKTAYYRRLGVVESLFNTDGTDYEGRADLTMHLTVALRTKLKPDILRTRILLAWAVLRLRHILLSVRVTGADGLSRHRGHHENRELSVVDAALDHARFYVFEPPDTADDAIVEANKHLVWVEDYHDAVDNHVFFTHTQNVGRCIDEAQALSKLFVMPIDHTFECREVNFMLMAGHEIVDGLTSARWISSFIDLLNLPEWELMKTLQSERKKDSIWSRLPAAQESLYPPMKGSLARQRWSWLLTRVLRHTHRPNPTSFQNPLRWETPLTTATRLEPRFPLVFNYDIIPPLNSYRVRAQISPSATKRLVRICKAAQISVGSGGFALVALVMMLFEERRNPGIPMEQRLPFVGSFPVNPRPFLTGATTTGKEDSLMLAFSDGVTLPFLPSDLDLEGRLRLLGKRAHRQLRQYQKKPRSLEEIVHLGSKSPTQLLPMLYLSTTERLEARSKPGRKRGFDIQGAYPAATSPTLATCGVSSVGARGSVLSSGKYDLNHKSRDIIADFRNLDTSVRARDGEFLVGVVGDNDVIRIGVSYDGCAIDPALAEQWKQVIETILEEPSPMKAAPAHKL
jgi:hypothetical protein